MTAPAPSDRVPDRRIPDRRTGGRGAWRPLGYITALDGLRGIGLIFVFSFHAGYGWAAGALLCLSLFFTLSGFLITRLVLDEVFATQAMNVVAFWARRLRRLLPAAMLGILFVLILSATAVPVDAGKLQGDALAALGYSANWHFIFSGQGYLEQFAGPSMLLHYWSLSLEEQFYLLYPLLIMGVLHFSPKDRPRQFRRNLRIVLVILVAVSLGSTLFARATNDFDLFYYGLPTRGGEILLGALMATSTLAARVVRTRATWWTNAIGGLSLLGITALLATTTFGSEWIHDGGLVAFAILSCGLIFSVLPFGPIASFIGIWPLRWLGKISYGFYIFHWPIILWLTPERTGLHGSALIALQAATTFAVAIPCYFLVEQPIRRGHMFQGPSARWATPLALLALALCTLFVTNTLTRPLELDLASAKEQLAEVTSEEPAGESGSAALPDVGFYGDSTGLMTALGLADWGIANGHLHVVPGVVDLGCSLTRGGLMRYQGRVTTSQQDCESGVWSDAWPPNLASVDPDIAVVVFGPGDVADRQLAGDAQWRAPGDPVYDAHLKSEMLAAADLLLTRGYTVVWLTSPVTDPGRGAVPPIDDPTSDPARTRRFNQLLREVKEERPAVQLVDLAAWMDRWPGGALDPVLRPDGVHFAREAAATELAPWLGPAILRAARAADRSASSRSG